MAKQRGRESNTGLVVTLVFFILTAIGLGVATYYGFAGQGELTAKAATADKAAKDAEKERDWYKFQAWTYRAYLGQTAGIDDTALKVYREQFDANQLGKDEKDREDVVKLIKAIEDKKYRIAKEDKNKTLVPQDVQMAWDKDTKRPKVTYDDVFMGLNKLVEYQEKQTAAALTAKDEADAAAKKSDEEKVAAQKAYDENVAKLTKQNNDDLAKERKDNDDLRNLLKAANDATAASVQAGEDKAKTIQKGVAEKDTKIKQLEVRLADLNERIETMSKHDTDAPENGKPIPTDWRIVKMDASGKKPFINLGAADNIHPPLTFSIHGKGPDGKPLAASKGSLEVIDVLGDHLAQAQLVSAKDAFKDPILPGDYLYNPIFNPSAERHVVIAGRIDMHGVKGQDDLEEFERLLKRQNVVVDGYVDPQDGTIKGKLTVGTDFLILGDIVGAKPEVAASTKSLQEQARNNGVHIISAREFLDSIGYRTP